MWDKLIVGFVIAICLCGRMSAMDYRDTVSDGMRYSGEAVVNIGNGDFAPYFIASNSGGVITQPAGAYARIKAIRDMNTRPRFDYGFGADFLGGYASATDYLRYYPRTGWGENPQRPESFRIQQLYGEIRYRAVFLTAGLKENDRSLFDSPLASGDITLSNNARPIPQVRAGFLDFTDIPLTSSWAQIRGEIAYGRFFDNNWINNHADLYNEGVTTGVFFHYASIYFRSNPEKRFSLTVGMQHAAQFGGTKTWYYHGNIVNRVTDKVSLGTFAKMFIPMRDGTGISTGDKLYYRGNHLGSWDLKATYRLRDDSRITFSWQSPWEDGTGIGKANGWDGVYGIEYRFARKGIINAARFEALTFVNQSGPIHWAVGDHPGTHIPGTATGSDNYYNNQFYNGWANYGMSLGTPFLKSPIYNTDGQLLFKHTRTYGFHAGIEGSPLSWLDYRVLWSWRKSAGTYNRPLLQHQEDTSMLFEGNFRVPRISGLTINARIAFDAGSLYGNHFGVAAGVTYSGAINFKSSRK